MNYFAVDSHVLDSIIKQDKLLMALVLTPVCDRILTEIIQPLIKLSYESNYSKDYFELTQSIKPLSYQGNLIIINSYLKNV